MNYKFLPFSLLTYMDHLMTVMMKLEDYRYRSSFNFKAKICFEGSVKSGYTLVSYIIIATCLKLSYLGRHAEPHWG